MKVILIGFTFGFAFLCIAHEKGGVKRDSRFWFSTEIKNHVQTW